MRAAAASGKIPFRNANQNPWKHEVIYIIPDEFREDAGVHRIFVYTILDDQKSHFFFRFFGIIHCGRRLRCSWLLDLEIPAFREYYLICYGKITMHYHKNL